MPWWLGYIWFTVWWGIWSEKLHNSCNSAKEENGTDFTSIQTNGEVGVDSLGKKHLKNNVINSIGNQINPVNTGKFSKSEPENLEVGVDIVSQRKLQNSSH